LGANFKGNPHFNVLRKCLMHKSIEIAVVAVVVALALNNSPPTKADDATFHVNCRRNFKQLTFL